MQKRNHEGWYTWFKKPADVLLEGRIIYNDFPELKKLINDPDCDEWFLSISLWKFGNDG